MKTILNILIIIGGILLTAGLLGWLGLQIQPQSFPAFPGKTQQLKTTPLPTGLPALVERFYRTIYDMGQRSR